jgi:hypothetical protein
VPPPAIFGVSLLTRPQKSFFYPPSFTLSFPSMKKTFIILSAVVIAIAIGVILAFPKRELLNTKGIPASVQAVAFFDMKAALNSKLAKAFPDERSELLRLVESNISGVTDAKTEIDNVIFFVWEKKFGGYLFRGNFSAENFDKIKMKAKENKETIDIGNHVFWENQGKNHNFWKTKCGIMDNNTLLLVETSDAGQTEAGLGEIINAHGGKLPSYPVPDLLKNLSKQVGKPIFLVHSAKENFLELIAFRIARESQSTIKTPVSAAFVFGEDGANLKFRLHLELATAKDAQELQNLLLQLKLGKKFTETNAKLKTLLSAVRAKVKDKTFVAELDYPTDDFIALFNPKTAIAFGTPFANASAFAHCPLRSTNRKVRLGKVQCATARSLCEIRPKPIAVFGFNKKK